MSNKLPEAIKWTSLTTEECLKICLDDVTTQHIFFNFTITSEEECNHDHDHVHHDHEHEIEEEYNCEITDERVKKVLSTIKVGEYYQEYYYDEELQGVLMHLYEVTEIIKDSLGNLFIFADKVEE